MARAQPSDSLDIWFAGPVSVRDGFGDHPGGLLGNGGRRWCEGGLGKMAIDYGYLRRTNDVLCRCVIIIVQLIQMIGDDRLVDHR